MNVQVIQNREEQLVHQMGPGCHPKGPGQAGELGSHDVLHREMQGPAPGEEQPQVPVCAGGQLAAKWFCREEPGDPGGCQIEHDPATHQRKPTVSWAALEVLPSDGGSRSFPSAQH